MTEMNIHNVTKIGFRHKRFDASECEVVTMRVIKVDYKGHHEEVEITFYSPKGEPMHLLIGDTE